MRTVDTNRNLNSRQSGGVRQLHGKPINAELSRNEPSDTVSTKIAENVQSEPETTKLIIPDPDEIRPRRAIPRAEITEVENWHQELEDLRRVALNRLRRLALNRAFDIGFRLRCWHELIPHGKWLPWLKANVAIPERTASQYLLLWDHNEEIKAAFKSADNSNSADLSDLPPIKDALALIADKRAEKRTKAVKANQVVHRIPAASTSVEQTETETDASDETDSHDQSAELVSKAATTVVLQPSIEPQPNTRIQSNGKTRLPNKPPKDRPPIHEYCEVGWVLLTTERDMAVLALTPGNEKWKKSALEFFESLRIRKIQTVS
jgi:hypothetical protein